MKTLILSAALAAGVGALGSSAQAIPLAMAKPAAPSSVIEVRNGCGAGWYRGASGVCHPVGRPYVTRPYPVYRPAPPVRCWWVETPYGPRRVCRW